MVLVYRPEARPTQLLRDLLLTYWDTRVGNKIPRPIIIEKPAPDYQRADLRNDGDHIIISMQGFQERHITIAFQHREITVDMLLEVKNCTSRQRMYDIVQEIRRIIFSKQHEPDDFLLDGFETYADSTALNVAWNDTTGFSTITLNTSIAQFGNNSLRVITAGGIGEAYRSLPYGATLSGATIPLLPEPNPGRLQQVRFYGKVDSGSPIIGVTLRDASNRSGLFRTWNVTINTTSFVSYTADLSATPDAAVGTWDESLIDELAFTSIDSGRTLDIDHIDLATDEFQFLQYTGYAENVEVFEYWEADLRAAYRSHGDVVDVLT